MHAEASSPGEVETVFSDTAMAIHPGIYAPVMCMVERRPSRNEKTRKSAFRGVRLGQVDVFKFDGIGQRQVHRKLSHIQADGVTDYLVSIPLKARIDFSQAGHTDSVQAGMFTLLSTAAPFSAAACGGAQDDPFSALHVRVSGMALRQRMPFVDAYCDRSIRLRPGAGVIMRTMCDLAVTEGRKLSHSEAAHFGSMLVDSVVNAIMEAPELLSLSQRSTRPAHLKMWRQANAFIESNLSDPALDIGLVAAHLRVTKRYIQTVFSELGETVTTTIRELRLQRCRAAIRDPALQHYSIASIAVHWGFNDIPYFCRAYRARFERSPRQDRKDSH